MKTDNELLAKKDKIIARFWGCVDRGENCWLWTKGCFSNGYGQFRVGSRKVKAHRFAFELSNRPIPDGLCVCHHCDNKKCVNPTHLFLGTIVDNNKDRDRKGRTARGESHKSRTHPESVPRGERNHFSKLKKGDIKKIRELCEQGRTHSAIARCYGMCATSIGDICRRTSWKHV